MWPLTQNIMEANIGHLPSKFGYKQMQGWKVINRYRVLQVKLHIWPHLTFDLLMWPLTPEYHGGLYRASTNQVWLQTDAGLESYSSFVSVMDGRRTDRRRTGGRNLDPLVSPPPRWARQKLTCIMQNILLSNRREGIPLKTRAYTLLQVNTNGVKKTCNSFFGENYFFI